jgi:hypothetical protein
MFTFNKSYKDLTQVEPFYAEFKKIKDNLDGYAYNDCFKGKIAEIAGDNEDTAIYLLQSLDTEKTRQAKIAELEQNGYTRIKPEAGGMTKFESVVKIGNNYSRGGVDEYPKARIWFAEGSMYIVPKGNRTRGYNVYPGSVVYAK